MEDFEFTQEITSDGINDMQVDTAITDDQVKEVLGEIEAEIGAEIDAAHPTSDPDGKVKEHPKRIGEIAGAGTGTSDDIPAMLSDGEFVMTAKAVRNAGGGSRKAGAKNMYKMMKSLENGGSLSQQSIGMS